MKAIIGLIVLIIVIINTVKWRYKNYSIKCPRCGKILRPKTTGLRGKTGYIYKYKCSNCGYTYRNS